MCEMLGNQYYITKKFNLALSEFEKVLLKHPKNNCAKKKLVICNIKLGLIRKAFDDFYYLLMNNINCLLKCDFAKDECPCVEIIYDIESYQCKLNDFEKNLALGMLWISLNIEESIEYFNKVLNYERKFRKIFNVITKLNQIHNKKIRG